MRTYIFSFLFSMLIYIPAVSGNNDPCACEEIQNQQSASIATFEQIDPSKASFTESMETSAVRGVTSARYLYCDEEHSLLLVNLHDEILLYKGVPMNVWFEFKFAKSTDAFYRSHIKYEYIPQIGG